MARKFSKAGIAAVAAAAGVALAARAARRGRRRISFSGASVVITGGSRGLGLVIARKLAREGARLALLARDPEGLERARQDLLARGADVVTHVCNVRNRADVEEALDAVLALRGRIDVLINNAGIVQVAPFENLEIGDFRECMDIHAWGPLYAIHKAVPVMKRQGGGRIVNISSIGGVVAVPHLAAYCMSKFALTGLSEGVRAELAKDNILVTTVIPGLMRTGSHVNACFKGQHRKEFAWFSLSGANPLLSATAEHAADRIISACRYGDPRLVITVPALLLHLFNAMFPHAAASATAFAARLLPRAVPEGNTIHTGWESSSPLSPSFFTRPADRVVSRNNELR